MNRIFTFGALSKSMKSIFFSLAVLVMIETGLLARLYSSLHLLFVFLYFSAMLLSVYVWNRGFDIIFV